MIYLHTGLPGAGKTLNTLVEVRARALKEKRPVFYSGINELKLPGWSEFGEVKNPDSPHLTDPSKWYELPHKSIIVIDECQRLWRQRHYGSAVPDFVSKLETHRHYGWDLHLITQDPRLLDTNLRRLVGRHIHYVRTLGGANAVARHEWNEIRDDVQKRDDSTMTLVPYNKEAFTWYKSAEVHTHKVRIPSRVLMLVAIPVAIGACAWFAWTSLGSRMAPKAAPVEASKKGPEAKPAGPVVAAPGSAAAGLTAAQYVASYAARVPGLPHTAPRYDAITTPTVAPRPAACLQMKDRCECFTQQATRLDVTKVLCESIVARGWFQEWHDQEAPNGQLRGEGRPAVADFGGMGASSPHASRERSEATEPDRPRSPPSYIKARGFEGHPASQLPLQAGNAPQHAHND